MKAVKVSISVHTVWGEKTDFKTVPLRYPLPHVPTPMASYSTASHVRRIKCM